MATPAGVAREEMTYHDSCVVEMEANVLETAPGCKPTSELLMHLGAYKVRTDVFAVVHTHTRFDRSLVQ